MPQEPKTVSQDSVRPKRRFTQTDWQWIADYIGEEHHRRKGKRTDLEKHWAEIDRQLKMEPDLRRKLDTDGNVVETKRWMAEMELPLQSQTLEVLTADARRLMFPDSGSWFMPHAEMTDEYLRKVDFKSLILGDENDVPSQVNQDNADKLVEGWINHIHRQYDFFANYDQINAEAFKYGVGIGRLRAIQKPVYMETSKGIVKEDQTLPVLVPQSIKNTYLDDREFVQMNEGMMLGPAVIYERTLQFEQLKIAANRGSNNPNSMTGGWMPAMLNKVDANDNGSVMVLEYEGDLVVPRKTVRSMVIPGAIVTVVIGKSDKKTTRRVIRFRFRQTPYTSYIPHPYHHESLETPYATAPLMKGRPIQMAGAHTLNQLIDAGELSLRPPVSWNRNDPHLAATGGPVIEPGRLWETNGTSQIDVQNDIGDPATSLAVYGQLLTQYYDVTGVNQPRLGAQTVSHTTAFAKEAELSRGTIRTVDYVRSAMKGPLTKFLYMEYDLSKRLMGRKNHTFYIDSYRGFVEIDRSKLPDKAMFEAFGSGGPAEQAQKRQDRLQALQLAMQVDQLKVQFGLGEPMNYEEIQRQILLDGGWIDVDPWFTEGAVGGNQGTSTIPATGGGDPGAAAALLQSLPGRASA